MRKRHIPADVKDMQVADGWYPMKGAAKAMRDGRQRQLNQRANDILAAIVTQPCKPFFGTKDKP